MYQHPVILSDMPRIAAHVQNLDQLRGKNILITGATGMLAAYLTYFLIYLNRERDFGLKIFALGRKEQDILDHFGENVTPVVQDVTQPIKVAAKIDYIFHFAGIADPTTLSAHPLLAIDINILGLRSVIDLAREQSAEIFFASTREIYGQMPAGVTEIAETDQGILDCCDVRSCYPESKRLCETMLNCAASELGIKFKNARLAHVFGPGMALKNDGRVMADLISDVISARNITLKSSGEALRAFCYVADAIAAILTVVLNGQNGENYNISNETEEISIKNLAEKLIAMYPEKHLAIDFVPETDTKKYVKFSRVKLSNTKLRALGFDYFTNLETGIRQTVDFATTSTNF